MPAVLSVPCDTTGPSVARRFASQFAADLRLDDIGDVLCTIVSELVTNAIVHGAPPVELALLHQVGAITIEVADGDPHIEFVRPPAARDDEPGGRGLRVVGCLADRWGTRPSQPGKTVWATMHVTQL